VPKKGTVAQQKLANLEEQYDTIQDEIDALTAKNKAKKGARSEADYLSKSKNSYSRGGNLDFWQSGTGSGKGAATYSTQPRCYTTHKPMPIGEYLIYGGSCSTPMVKDADIYVGFERGMQESTKSYPWVEGDSFYFPIVDGNVPTSLEDTMLLLEYLADNLKAGKKIHIGCIGGHGRTGTILAALVHQMTGNKDAIAYVRANYCEKAVESTTQINWLHKHFGINKATPSKSGGAYGGQGAFGFAGKGSAGVSKTYNDMYSEKSTASNAGYVFVETVKPVRVKGNVFGF
jgi:hypothetical protein